MDNVTFLNCPTHSPSFSDLALPICADSDSAANLSPFTLCQSCSHWWLWLRRKKINGPIHSKCYAMMGSRNIPFPVNCSLGAGEDLISVSHCISPWLYLLHPLVHETDSQPWFCAQLAHSGPHQPMIFAASSLLSPPLVSVMNFFFFVHCREFHHLQTHLQGLQIVF